MEVRERDKLLLARADELRREYDNLVRSLSLAYDTINAINRALTENRLESRKIFEERLVLASPNNLTSQVDKKKLNFKRSDVDNNNQAFDQILKKLLNQYIGDNPRLDEFVASANQKLSQYIATHDDDVDCSDDVTTGKNFVSDAQRHYIGDDHSYAVNENAEDEHEENQNELSVRQMIIEDRLNKREVPTCAATIDVTTQKCTGWREVVLKNFETSAEKRVRQEKDHCDVDLSIVKTEWPDESNEMSNYSEDRESNLIVTLSAKKKNYQIIRNKNIERKKIVSRIRKTKDMLENELLEKKRRQTRERMRRWRAKKRLQEVLNLKVVP